MVKVIKDFPDYKITSEGEVISMKSGKEKTVKQYVKTSGYLYVALSDNGKRYYRRVHRLVAEAFIPNPLKLPEVNHKNEDKTDNSVDNLEWCTRSYNNLYGTRSKKVALKVSDPTIPRANNTSGRKGVTITRYGTYVAFFHKRYLGTFKTFDEAVTAREKAELNFFNPNYRNCDNS